VRLSALGSAGSVLGGKMERIRLRRRIGMRLASWTWKAWGMSPVKKLIRILSCSAG